MSCNQRPLISIVIINYNYGRFLGDCLRSVDAQNYGGRIECIVIDNASTDGSRAVFDAFVHARHEARDNIGFSFEAMADNLRLTRGCYEGFRLSTGRFVCFLDADDWLLPGFVEAQVYAHLTSRVAVGASSVDMLQSTPDGMTSATTPSFTAFIHSNEGRSSRFQRDLDADAYGLMVADRESRPITLDQVHLVERHASSRWVWSPTSSLMFRREALDLMFGAPPTLVASVDAFLLRGIGSLTGTLLIDAPLAVYRHHGSNIFAKSAPLANFRSFVPDQLREDDRLVAQAVIATFLAARKQLAASLLDPNHYIEAIEIVAASGMRPLVCDNPTFVAALIRDNRQALEDAFGAHCVSQWVGRYHPWLRQARTWLAWFKTRAMPRPSQRSTPSPAGL